MPLRLYHAPGSLGIRTYPAGLRCDTISARIRAPMRSRGDSPVHDETNRFGTRLDPALGFSAASAAQKLLLLLIGYLSFAQVAALGTIVWLLHSRPAVCISAILVGLYLVPPITCRVVAWLLPIRRRRIEIGSRDFFVWWFVLNLQMLFCRFSALEEVLRVVPGCYSMWLRVWGAKVGRLTYWAAGVRVLDRQALAIGNDVTFGAGSRLASHVMLADDQGRLTLVLAPIKIGDRVTVGGYSLLTAGSEIAADQCTRAFLILPPMNRLENGRRIKPERPVGSG